MSISEAGRECLRFSMIKGFGLKKFHQLVAASGSLSYATSANPAQLEEMGLIRALAQQIGESNLKKKAFRLPSHVEDWLADDSNQILCIEDEAYPELLKQTHLAPPLLYVSGSIDALTVQQLAIVGSRKPSAIGKSVAQEFAFGCASYGFSICSGLALGIDANAHMGAMAADGKTVAVIATGADRCYPKAHQELAREIVERGGCLISEMPLGTAPLRQNFPRRNRIVSGLSLGVLVVEAGLKSGSLITARYAIEQNREVFAVPGGPRNASTEGCNWLIKEGACLVTSPEELLHHLPDFVSAELNSNDPARESSLGLDLEPSERALLEVLGDAVMTVDELYVSTHIELDRLTVMLLELEVKGILAPTVGGYQRLT